MIIGIDPGLSGAIALIDTLHGDGEFRQAWDMPVREKVHGKGREVNAYLLRDILAEALELGADTAVIERVGSMPGQGVASTFAFGQAYGVVLGVLAGLLIPVEGVTPQRWKKHFGLVGKDKDASRGLCIDRWPASRQMWARKMDCGRADAALIGLYGRQCG